MDPFLEIRLGLITEIVKRWLLLIYIYFLSFGYAPKARASTFLKLVLGLPWVCF